MFKRFLATLICLSFSLGCTPQVQAAENKLKTDFVEIQQIVPTVILDIKYATKDNFTHAQLYGSSKAFLRRGTANKLKKVADEVQKKGYRLKIWDAYRSPEAQHVMWNLVADARYVANPNQGYSNHSRGSAVDLTLVDSQGHELAMPTGFDSFTAAAARVNENDNARYLEKVMLKHGFKPLTTEWWHFDDKDLYKVAGLAEVTPAGLPDMEKRNLTISAIGDVTLGQDERFLYAGSFNEYYKLKGPEYFFSGTRNILGDDDLSIANLEGTLTEAADKPDKRSQGTRAFFFKGNPHYSAILKAGSIEAVNLANNHSQDFLSKGFNDTADDLEHAEITCFGNERIAVFEKNGLKIGLIGLNTLGALEEGVNVKSLMAELSTAIKALKESTSLIVVSFHWGRENDYSPTQEQRTLGHYAIDQGADLVLGHHPHVLQPYEVYKGKCIVYSLGNFVFGGNSKPWYKNTAIFRQTYCFVGGKLVETCSPQIIPCVLSASFRPEPAK